MAREVHKSDAADTSAEVQRLDKWLWFARVIKTRTSAAGLISDGRVRVNRVRITKPSQTVRAGDVITISVAGGVRVLEIVAAGKRRGPASEAAELYNEIVPLQRTRSTHAARPDLEDGTDLPGPGQGAPMTEAGSGRPTKRDRRVLDRLRSRNDD